LQLPELCEQVNIGGIKNILEAIKDAGNKAVLVESSGMRHCVLQLAAVLPYSPMTSMGSILIRIFNRPILTWLENQSRHGVF
jgi:hypothetical protein